jgi:hypothetical protein
MVVGTSNNSSYWIYRCPPTGDCKRRVTISAELVEGVVVADVRDVLANAERRASVEDNARAAEVGLESAQQDLDGAIRAFSGLHDEPVALERLADLRATRDQAQERVDHLPGPRPVLTINAAHDRDRLSLDAKRALIRAVVSEVRVGPGRGVDRIMVKFVGCLASETAPSARTRTSWAVGNASSNSANSSWQRLTAGGGSGPVTGRSGQ